MTEETATVVDVIVGSKPTDDGKFGLIAFASGGNQFPLAFPKDLLPTLASAALTAKSHCDAKSEKKGSPLIEQAVQAFPVEWWEIGSTSDRSMVVLSFRIPGGGWARFQVHPQAAQAMREVLEAVLGQNTSPQPSGARN